MFFTTGLQVTGAELLCSAMDSDGSSGSRSVTSSTGHWTVWPKGPWFLCTFRQTTATSTQACIKHVISLIISYSKCHRRQGAINQQLTKAGFSAAAINPNSVPFAGLTPKSSRRVGFWSITPSHTNITRPTACAPLGPAAPTTVHYDHAHKKEKQIINQKNARKSIIHVHYVCYSPGQGEDPHSISPLVHVLY